MDRSISDAESVSDVAAAALRTPAGDIRKTLERWIVDNAPGRSRTLRSQASTLPADLQTIFVSVAAHMDAVAKHASESAPYEEEQTLLGRVLADGRERCPGVASKHESTKNGRLTPESIQVVVRAHFARLRSCYADGLTRNANLRGRITTKFVIDREGNVGMDSSSDDEVGDSIVVQCIARGFGRMRFGRPRGGMVTVVYPIQFSPEEAHSPSE